MRGLALSILIMLTVAVLPPLSWALTPSQRDSIQQMKRSVEDMFGKGKHQEAIAVLEKILQIDPADKTALRYLNYARQRLVEPSCSAANDAYMSGDYSKAITGWKGILERNPGDMRVAMMIELTKNLIQDSMVNALYVKANAFMEAKDYAGAVREMEKALVIQPGDPQAMEFIANARQIMKNAQVKVLYDKADQYLKDMEYDLAIKSWEKVLAIDSTQEQASRLISETRKVKLGSLYDLARSAYEGGDYNEALGDYERLLADNPTDTDSREIISRLKSIIKIAPRIDGADEASKILRISMANFISVEGNVKVAIVASWYATQLAPSNTQAQAVRAFLETRFPTELMTLESPMRDMNIIDQYLFSALNSIYVGRYDFAVQVCSIIIAIDPANVLAYKRLGSAYYAMERKDKARQAWERALQLKPDDSELKQFIKK